MTDTSFLNTLLPALLVVAMLVVSFKAGPKAKIILALLGTAYMLVHALVHPNPTASFLPLSVSFFFSRTFPT